MHFAKSLFIALLGLGAMAFAAPIENVEAATLDGCDSARKYFLTQKNDTELTCA